MIEPRIAISTEDVAGHYDELDEYYRLLWGEHLHHGLWETGKESVQQATVQLIEYCLKRLELTPGDQLCDIGSGYGGTSRYAAEKGLNVTGLTISKAQHQYASSQSSGALNPTYLLRNWESNGLEDESFDGAISIECIAHVEDKTRYFGELRRVLRPGARAAITHWVSTEGTSTLANRFLLEPICREGRLPAMGTAEDYRQLAQRAGLRVILLEDLTKKVRRTWLICLWRVTTNLLLSHAGWKFLLTSKSRHAVYLFSLFRIAIAYYVGSMTYRVLVVERD